MDVKDIKKLLDAIADADVREFSYETGDFKLTVQRGAEQVLVHPPEASAPPAATGGRPGAPAATGPQPAPAAEAEPPPAVAGGDEDPGGDEGDGSLVAVTAPIVGTFYEAPAPDAAPYVQVGDRVKAGTVLCIIEAMKLMNEIEAETPGTVREILVRNEDPVEYGQPLFRIEPD